MIFSHDSEVKYRYLQYTGGGGGVANQLRSFTNLWAFTLLNLILSKPLGARFRRGVGNGPSLFLGKVR